MASATSVFDFKPLNKKGEPTPLSDYAGKVLLIVNTASKCGFTPQYAGLEALYKKIQGSHPDEFVILGFPCNQFGGQEPENDDKIQDFCQINYGVTFPIFGKTQVNGDGADPLWEYIKKEKPGLMGLKRVKWNFEKFLIGRDGKVVERWASTKKPEDLESEVLKEIEKKAAAKAELGDTSGTLSTIDNGSIDVYIATPATPKPGKAILLVPDVNGIAQNANLIADQLAANGYYTVIPDIFNKDSLSNPYRPDNFNIMDWIQHGMRGDNPHTVPHVDAIVAKALDYLQGKGYTDIGAVGYCFGAKYVVRFMSEEKGTRIKVGYVAHPSFVDEAELEAIKGPLSISAAETDTIFPVEKRQKSEEILVAAKVPYQINLFSGVSHGYAVRGDPKVPQEKWAKEQSFEQAVKWFNFHL